jgi:hypothetical protein
MKHTQEIQKALTSPSTMVSEPPNNWLEPRQARGIFV